MDLDQIIENLEERKETAIAIIDLLREGSKSQEGYTRKEIYVEKRVSDTTKNVEEDADYVIDYFGGLGVVHTPNGKHFKLDKAYKNNGKISTNR
tara:strand:- start:265 stop:546 length:282 start_codon:yes stop_codon:yes gene_type:complete